MIPGGLATSFNISHMTSPLLKTALRAALPLLTLASASGHVSYTGRNFGTFTGLTPQSTTISNQTIPSNFGWADGTDVDFGDSHKVRPFRFTLQSSALITISATASGAGLLPAFSVFAGLAHISPQAADHDTSQVSLNYLATLGGTHEGTFDALHDFKMGSDEGMTAADLSSFLFRGYAADGTAANFGSAPGVTGDGLADGTISKTFQLAPGDYTLFFGGANYGGQAPTPDTAVYPMTATVSSQAVPEPSTALIAGAGLALLGSFRQRRRTY